MTLIYYLGLNLETLRYNLLSPFPVDLPVDLPVFFPPRCDDTGPEDRTFPERPPVGPLASGLPAQAADGQ